MFFEQIDTTDVAVQSQWGDNAIHRQPTKNT
jgi:hypothetical protein